MKYSIEINKGINPFYIGESIEEFLVLYSYNFSEGEDYMDKNWYEFFDDSIEVSVLKENNNIRSIACRDNCYLDGINLIGLNINKFLERFKIEYGECEIDKDLFVSEDETQDCYDIDKMGLQIWVNKQKKIVAVYVYSNEIE